MQTEVTKLLGIEYPIIQGGMAWVAEYHLAAAVSEAGGLGLIGAASAPAEWVRDQIREAKKLTDKPFGVNIMLMSPYADEVAKVVAEEGGARADGGHIHTAPQTDYGQSDEDGGNGQHAHFLPEFSLPGVCLFQLAQVMVGQPHPPPRDNNEYA